MAKRLEDIIPENLFRLLKERFDIGSDDFVKVKMWSSLVCMLCGGCCHSSMVPISREDALRFFKRLDLKIDEDRFLDLFLQDRSEDLVKSYIKTEGYEGRCPFLEKVNEKVFACSRWNERPDVCRDFFCWPMNRFALYMKGKDQEMFDQDVTWDENFLKLFDKVLEEMTGALFFDDMFYFQKSKVSKGYSSFVALILGKDKE